MPILKTPLVIFLGFVVIVPGSMLAHEGHDHSLTPEQAILKAASDVELFVDDGNLIDGQRLDDSWKQVIKSGVCKKNPVHFVISFDHRAAGKTLYVLLSTSGKYMRANFKGNFADVTFSPYPIQSC